MCNAFSKLWKTATRNKASSLPENQTKKKTNKERRCHSSRQSMVGGLLVFILFYYAQLTSPLMMWGLRQLPFLPSGKSTSDLMRVTSSISPLGINKVYPLIHPLVCLIDWLLWWKSLIASTARYASWHITLRLTDKGIEKKSEGAATQRS